MIKKGLFVCFIGIDGSGKTTHTRNLKSYIENSGRTCNYMWCGWRSFDSILFRPIVKFIKILYPSHKSDMKKGSSINHIEYFAVIDYILRVFPEVIFSLYKYDYTIADRYIIDVMAGFSYSKNSILKKIFWIFPKPDIIFYINIPEHIAYSRKNDIPSIDHLTKLKNRYNVLVKDYDIMSINGIKNEIEILNIVKKEMKKIE